MGLEANRIEAGESASCVDLTSFDNRGFDRGRSAAVEALWMLVQALVVSSFVPGSAHRRLLLRIFGASIGRRVTIKPGLRVKFPWRLRVGNDVWLGEGVWIDNLAAVEIGDNVCISQGAYLCTGSHDWSRRTFDLVTRPIKVESGAWIAAKAVVAPGVTVAAGAVLSLGSSAVSDLAPMTIYAGVPARAVRPRRMQSTPGDPASP